MFRWVTAAVERAVVDDFSQNANRPFPSEIAEKLSFSATDRGGTATSRQIRVPSLACRRAPTNRALGSHEKRTTRRRRPGEWRLTTARCGLRGSRRLCFLRLKVDMPNDDYAISNLEIALTAS